MRVDRAMATGGPSLTPEGKAKQQKKNLNKATGQVAAGATQAAAIVPTMTVPIGLRPRGFAAAVGTARNNAARQFQQYLP